LIGEPQDETLKQVPWNVPMDATEIGALTVFCVVLYFIVFLVVARVDERRDLKEKEQANKRKEELEKRRLEILESWEMDPDYWKKGLTNPWDKEDSGGDPIREPSPTE